MIPPTLAQQAFAPIPFAIISFFSSSYVIYHLIYKEREKLKRMYHRLILALNVAILPMSFTWVWGAFAVPAGTPYYPVASGTIQTCTASALIYMMFSYAIPTYYASLSLQAFMGIKNNFKEEKYKWIEKWVHLVASGIPFAFAIVYTTTQNYNPYASGCYIAKAPRGCETEPDVPCQRGKDLEYLTLILGLGLVFLYFFFPPAVMISMYCWIGKVDKKIEGSMGMQKIRESAQKQMMQSVARHISVYLFSFWSTWVLSLIHTAYWILTGWGILYELLIVSNSVYASQGFIFAVVYFRLQRVEQPEAVRVSSSRLAGLGHEITVRDIRLNAESEAENGSEIADAMGESYNFNIFDGVPDEDSPWARFIDQDDNEGT